MSDGSRPPARWRSLWLPAGAALVAGVILVVLLDRYRRLLAVNPSTIHLLKALIVLGAGAVIARVVEGSLLNRPMSPLSPRQRTVARFAIRLLLYLGIALAVLAALGVGLSSVVFGGAFLTVIIGLAGQTMFANILGGIWLVLFQPFQVGETISIIAWQYPLLMPSYPHEAMKPVYTGQVVDINLMYTAVRSEDGDPMVFPNGVLVQSAIINRSRAGARRIRVRFEVAPGLEPARLLPALGRALATLAGEEARPAVYLTDLGAASYWVGVTLWSTDPEEAVKGQVLETAWRVLKSLEADQAPASVKA
ncbi:Small-conductance mechanosensitive channel [Candidatus Hydrogenisulfobacillus filiaventi]|uniref:Small-conductance mechanosensitive channel n=1 Tax=Candidatus Hydrogenisulfobacillus filiaventi TaxID=2707344 RepID=A0A6F8ZER2_9FIRM|nr:mechanosensitive ion channel family protein [Bacillota bacterium]CAB1128486.1 Small-conductance mechanosensitive channel [Candidatus Hydrogenisulfobacillus filiaventi]